QINGQPATGIGTHAESVIIYDLPEGYDTFAVTGYVTRDGGSVMFGVLVDKGTVEITDATDVKVDFASIGITGKANVRDLWAHKDLGGFTGHFSQKLPIHGAGLYRISPQVETP
ncbi:MAG TPA: NPCBM/NEW2 domain-containing protein, partial [Candidatus Paceibacterota bacterium]|nr:NPCBM/NEW2 domain-containing protein [Candidatus Paceibacterota bacterium]